MADLPPTPELDKRSEVMKQRRDPTWVLTEFYDYLKSEGLHLMKWETRPVEVQCPRIYCDNDDPNPHCKTCLGTGWTMRDKEDWWADGRTPERLFADFFGLDLTKIQDEQDALLKALQDNNKEKG